MDKQVFQVSTEEEQTVRRSSSTQSDGEAWSILNASHVPALRFDEATGKILSLNSAAIKGLGRTSASDISSTQTFQALFDNEDDFNALLTDVRSGTPVIGKPVCLKNLDGRPLPVTLSLHHENQGNCVIAVISDKSGDHHLQTDLENERQRLQDFADATSGWMWEMDAELRFCWLSREVEEISGMDRSRLLGKRRDEIAFPEMQDEKWLQHLDDLNNHRPFQGFEYWSKDRSGAPRCYRLNGTPIFDHNNKFTGYRGIAEDITSERQALDSNSRAEEMRRMVIQHLPTGVSLFDADDCLVMFNDKYEELAQPKGEQLEIGVRFEDMLTNFLKKTEPELSADQLAAKVSERMAGHREAKGARKIMRGGRWLNVLELRTQDGGMLHVLEDITDLVEALNDVEKSEVYLRGVIDSLPMAVDIWDSNECLVMANKTHREWMPEHFDALSPGSHVSESIRINAELDLADLGDEDIEDYIARRLERFVSVDSGEVEEIRMKGRWLQGSHHLLPDGSHVTTFTDVTELKEREEQLRQSQKMEAVGQLTGGVAHDFNNLLQVIIGNLEFLREDMTNSPDHQAFVERAIEATQKGASLTNNLLAFSRKQALQSSHQNLNERVEFVMNSARRILTATIKTPLELEEEVWSVDMDPNYFDSALLNMIINSRDAMPDGGRLTIETRNIYLDSEVAAIPEKIPPGEYARLSVTDTGCGVPDNLLLSIFEPFFTTKDVDKGSGLGLSMVFGFVRQSGGYLAIKSEVGTGTRVSLFFPRRDQENEL